MLLAALLSSLVAATAVPLVWKWATTIALGGGLVLVVCANLAKQDRFAARAEVLWQALEFVEETAPPSACIDWCSGPDLNIEEGIHFQWHLRDRQRRTDVRIRLLDSEGHWKERRELPVAPGPADLVITGTRDLPNGTTGHLLQQFASSYLAGYREFYCCVWVHEATPGSERIAHGAE